MKPRVAVRSPGKAAWSAFDVVVVGSSAGGLRALSQLLNPLRPGFPAAIVVVQHLSPDHRSFLAELLSRESPLPVKQAEDGEPLLPGVVYVASPDRHLLVNGRHLELTRTQPQHFSRPSIDLLFVSAAEAFGPRCMAVVLSGSGRDGSAGIRAIKEAGGTVLVQEPQSAEFPPMPQAALDTGCADHVQPLNNLGSVMQNLCLGRPAR